MANTSRDTEIKKNIRTARRWIEDIAERNANEADTSTRVHDICEIVMGFDRHEHITKEFQIPTSGRAVYCDLAVQINRQEPPSPDFLIEVKRVGVNLTHKYIGQAEAYAYDIGCEWVLVTNGRDWELYHISFTKPPQTTLVETWNIIEDTPAVLAEKFALLSYRSIRKDGLSSLWERYVALMPHNLLKILVSAQSLNSIRSKLKKAKKVTVSPEEIRGAIRAMLNEGAAGEMDKIKISLPSKKSRKPAAKPVTDEVITEPVSPAAQPSPEEPQETQTE